MFKRGAENLSSDDLSTLEAENGQLEPRIGNLSPQDLEDFSKTDWLIICFIGKQVATAFKLKILEPYFSSFAP